MKKRRVWPNGKSVVTRLIAPVASWSRNGLAVVEAVAKTLPIFGYEARKTINQADELNDASTADLVTEISGGVDKWPWFVQANSQPPQ